MSKKKYRSTCPISTALDLFGDKWSLLVVRDLLYYGERTYKDFVKADESISTARLAERLKKLESLRVLTKDKHPNNGKVFIYKLTPKGKDLAPIIIEFVTWGNKHLKRHISKESKAFAKKLEDNREATLKELMR